MDTGEQASAKPAPLVEHRLDPAAAHTLTLEVAFGALLLGFAIFGSDWWPMPLFYGFLTQSIFRRFEAYPYNVLYKSERPRWSFVLMLPTRWAEWLAQNPYRRALTWVALVALQWRIDGAYGALIFALGMALSRLIQNIIARAAKDLLMDLLKRS